MFAYIPARIGSKRIPKKNLKLLGDKPSICHVIESLLSCKRLNGIAVSTDSPEIQKLTQQYPNVVTLELRNESLSDDTSGFMDLVKHDLNRFCSYFNDDEVIFTLATSALIEPSDFEHAIQEFQLNRDGLTFSVTQFEHQPRLALELNSDGKLSALDKSAYLMPTKDLKPAFTDSGNFYLFKHSLMQKQAMFLDLEPLVPIILPKHKGIDVDTPEDWQLLEKSFLNRMKS